MAKCLRGRAKIQRPRPAKPLWGYENEADPIAVARKIDAALVADVNVFVYDWYWYQSRPFLEGALNEGFLKAPNNERMKFFLMWANHDVNNVWNNKISGSENYRTLWNADVSYDEFTKVLVPRFINYFKKPNYYKVGNKPLFALYLPKVFVRGMGSPETSKKAIEYFRAEAKKAGFDDIYLIFRYREGLNKVPIAGKEKATISEIMSYYTAQGAFNYNMLYKKHDYDEWTDLVIKENDKIKEEVGVYFPTVSTGWDNNPRFPACQFTEIVKGKNPLSYEKHLRATKKWLDRNIPEGLPKLVFINAWNEWTEGEFLEPDATYGYGFLNATARVFGGSGQAKE